jgi:DNA-directed RNA polymerase subunit RPC12/RpoP
VGYEWGDASEEVGMTPVATIIRCMECGGEAHLLTAFPEDDPPMPGDVVAYRCADCLERWDVVVSEEDFEESPDHPI